MMKTKNRNIKRCGFSLVEMLVVVAIMAIIFTGVMTMIGDSTEKAKMTTALSDFDAIARAFSIARANGTVVEIGVDGPVNIGAVMNQGQMEVEALLSSPLSSFPDEYYFSGNEIIYNDGTGSAVTFDFGDGRGPQKIKKRLL